MEEKLKNDEVDDFLRLADTIWHKFDEDDICGSFCTGSNVQKVRRKIIGADGSITWEFYRGVSTVHDIDANYQLLPNFTSMIQKISEPTLHQHHVTAYLTTPQ